MQAEVMPVLRRRPGRRLWTCSLVPSTATSPVVVTVREQRVSEPWLREHGNGPALETAAGWTSVANGTRPSRTSGALVLVLLCPVVAALRPKPLAKCLRALVLSPLAQSQRQCPARRLRQVLWACVVPRASFLLPRQCQGWLGGQLPSQLIGERMQKLCRQGQAPVLLYRHRLVLLASWCIFCTPHMMVCAGLRLRPMNRYTNATFAAVLP